MRVYLAPRPPERPCAGRSHQCRGRARRSLRPVSPGGRRACHRRRRPPSSPRCRAASRSPWRRGRETVSPPPSHWPAAVRCPRPRGGRATPAASRPPSPGWRPPSTAALVRAGSRSRRADRPPPARGPARTRRAAARSGADRSPRAGRRAGERCVRAREIGGPLPARARREAAECRRPGAGLPPERCP